MGREDGNIYWHRRSVTREELAGLQGHRGATVWMTGLSASGKSTLANAVARTLHTLGVRTYVLDGDNVRHGLCSDLGFSPEDRQENIRRIAEVAKLMTDAGSVTFAAFISPYRADRAWARALQPQDFVEVHVDCALDVCEDRDPKGIYRRVRAGEIPAFTGISAPYEAPKRPDVYLNTATMTIEGCVETLVTALIDRDVIAQIAPAELSSAARLAGELRQ